MISVPGTKRIQSPFVRYVIDVLTVALLYIISARVGQIFAVPPGNVTPVWLPSGIMVALAVIYGPRIWPGVFLGAFAGNAWAYFSLDSLSLATNALIAGACNGIGDVISTVGAVELLRKMRRPLRILGDYNDFALFIGLAVIAGPAVSALFGVTSLAALKFLAWENYLTTLITWWTGDGVGVLLLAPLILSWHELFVCKAKEKSGVKAILLMAGSALVACILFKIIVMPHWFYLVSYSAAPILLIVSLFMGQAHCFSALIAFTSVAVIATSQGIGPFSSFSQNLSLLELQLFLAVTSVVIALLSLTFRQRFDVDRLAKENALVLGQAQQLANIGSWDLDLVNNRLQWSDQAFRIFEIDPTKFRESYEDFLNTIHPEDRAYVDRAYQESLRGGKAYEIEHRLLMKDGRVKYVSERCETFFNDGGEPIRSLGTVQDITERKLADEKILRQAHYDSLTNLPNRFLSLDRLAQLLHEADRDKTSVAILFLDLDFFKNVNDSLGHHAGDDLLIDVAKRLSRTVRAGDTVGRLGGDEFLVLLRGIHSVDETQVAVEHVLASFRAPFYLNEREINISASIGIVMYPGGGDNVTEVLRNADLAMYQSKEQGRNSYSFFSAELNEHVSRRLAIEEALRHALERDELTVHYQPQINVGSGKVIGAEALLRWQNDTLGHIPPDEFIPIAEQTGLIVPIGEFVLKQSLNLLSRLKDGDYSKLILAVNLSPRQFKDPQLCESLKHELESQNIPATSLELEITEGLLMSGYSGVDETFQAIHELGIKIAMDDFGTGYSSLSYLRNYPFDSLKIDRTFINDIETHDGRELVNAAIAMGHALGLKVVAEGVETQSQLNALKELGCDYAQGYLFSKPVEEGAFLDLLRG